jgi:hypothetical protein
LLDQFQGHICLLPIVSHVLRVGVESFVYSIVLFARSHDRFHPLGHYVLGLISNEFIKVRNVKSLGTLTPEAVMD